MTHSERTESDGRRRDSDIHSTDQGGQADARSREWPPGPDDAVRLWERGCKRLLGRFYAPFARAPLAGALVFSLLALVEQSLPLLGFAAFLAATGVIPVVYQERRWRDEREGNAVYSPLVEIWEGRR